MGMSTMSCDEGMIFWSAFESWADRDKLLVRKSDYDIKIVDPLKVAVTDYQVDSSLIFRLANHSLKYWLFRQNPAGAYELFDENGKLALADITGVGDEVLYDKVNDGFLFIGTDSSATGVSVRLAYLSLSALNLKNILTTEPASTPDRGCGDTNTVVSTMSGEVILHPGCLTVGAKYYGPDGNIHIHL